MKWKGCRQEWRSAVCAGLYFRGFWESWGLGSDGFYVVYASTCHIYIYTSVVFRSGFYISRSCAFEGDVFLQIGQFSGSLC